MIYDEYGTEIDPQYDYYTERAAFCIATGVSRSEYDAMTIPEINAWVEVLETKNG
jgi:hypothetical protein